MYVPGTYTNNFFLIFRLMRYTYVFFFSLSGVLFTREKTIPQLNETVKQDKFREEPEYRVLRYTVMFARAFGIFCCFCLISYHIPGSSWYTCHFTSATSTGVCITGTSALVVCV